LDHYQRPRHQFLEQSRLQNENIGLFTGMLHDDIGFLCYLSLLILRDAPDIWPDNLAFFDIRYTAGYRISMPDIPEGQIPEIR
jgi:hypothetical protein